MFPFIFLPSRFFFLCLRLENIFSHQSPCVLIACFAVDSCRNSSLGELLRQFRILTYKNTVVVKAFAKHLGKCLKLRLFVIE